MVRAYTSVETTVHNREENIINVTRGIEWETNFISLKNPPWTGPETPIPSVVSVWGKIMFNVPGGNMGVMVPCRQPKSDINWQMGATVAISHVNVHFARSSEMAYSIGVGGYSLIFPG